MLATSLIRNHGFLLNNPVWKAQVKKSLVMGWLPRSMLSRSRNRFNMSAYQRRNMGSASKVL